MKHTTFALLALFVISTNCLSAQEFHVSPSGNDDNPGTHSQPFRTIAAARNAVRKVNRTMDHDIVVYLHGGVYPVPETIEFAPQDSGSNGHKIIYRAAEGEKPILTGGVTVTGWKLHNKEKNIYRAPAPKTLFRQVYIDDKPGVRARTPNRQSETSFGPYLRLKVPKKPECHIAKKDWAAVASVPRLDEVELVIVTHWYHQRIRIGEHRAIDKAVAVMPVRPAGKMTKKLHFYRVSYFFFENALAFIDTPREWYHDPREGFLYLEVDKGTDPNKLRVEVPVTPTLLTVRGTADNPVQDIEFRGLTFQCSNWDSPSRLGLNATQFVQPIGVKRKWDDSDYPTGTIRAAHARRIAFRDNTVRNAGSGGIQLFMNVDDSDIEGNQIYHIAANGIEIDAHAASNPKPEWQSTDVAVWNNHIYKAGQNYTNGGGLLAHNVRGLIVEHNHIHDMPYSGMQIGNQPGGMHDIGCGDNRIRFNHVHHCLQLHDDGGGIYTLGGIQKGSLIAENYVHDIRRTKWAGNYPIDLIYLDNYTSKILVKDNVVNGGRAAERNHSAGNTLINNTQSNTAVEKNAGIKPGYHPRAK